MAQRGRLTPTERAYVQRTMRMLAQDTSPSVVEGVRELFDLTVENSFEEDPAATRRVEVIEYWMHRILD